MCKFIMMEYFPEPPHCREYDPLAVQVAQFVGDQIATCLPAVIVEHIGSTAVPGCAGKGIIDLMVLYSQDQLPVVKQTLASLGFQPQRIGHMMPETRPMRVGALEFKGRTFPVHVHVIDADSPEVSDLRRFREQLRHDPALMSSYVAWKRAIVAAGVKDRTLYTRQKSVFVEAVLALPDGSGPPVHLDPARLPLTDTGDATTVQNNRERLPESTHELE